VVGSVGACISVVDRASGGFEFDGRRGIVLLSVCVM
jgi:hypothetical protein